MYLGAYFLLSQLNTTHLQVSFYIKTDRTRDLMVFPLEFKKASLFSPQSVGLQMDQVVPESPGRIATLQRQRREMQAPLFSFLLFKIPPSNPRLESQAM